MSKYVNETAAGRAVSAKIIMKNGKVVATVQVHQGASGNVLVNIFQQGDAVARSLKAAQKDKAKVQTDAYGQAMHFQSASAGGYGYDKETAALVGLYIDGHRMTDHCSRVGAPKPPKGRKLYPRDFKTPRGYSLANYVPQFITFGFNPEKHPNPNYDGEEGYGSCFRDSGLKYLEALGYKILTAI